MTTTSSRRALLRGFAALPALSGPAALAAITPEPHADAELLALEAELHALDAETDHMGRVTGDSDIDEHPDYEKVTDRRFAVIDAIVALPATTQAGVVAKARVLKTRSIEDDYTSTGEIAASLADDVIRLVGAPAT